MEPIHLLVTLDQRYLPPLRVMLKSLFVNNSCESFFIHLIHDSILADQIKELDQYCRHHDSRLIPQVIGADAFADAPVYRYWSKSMYYRLLASKLLPDTLEKILYLDPDILVINPIRPLYETDISGYLFAGAMHNGLTGPLSGHVNRLRLEYETVGYYNSGVLLMNLALGREQILEEDIFSYAQKHKNDLLLPDQDILNGLYGGQILPIDDSLYNYDARHYDIYRLLSGGEKDMDWVMTNTVLLHFCGKAKPWLKESRGRFTVLFRHYASLSGRFLEDIHRAETKPPSPSTQIN